MSLDGTLFQKSGVISGGASDLKTKAKRWDEKVKKKCFSVSPIFPIFISGFLFAFVYQQVDALRRQRDEKLRELKEVTEIRRREPELQNLQSQISGLENRLKFSKRDKEVTVSTCTCNTSSPCVHLHVCCRYATIHCINVLSASFVILLDGAVVDREP